MRLRSMWGRSKLSLFLISILISSAALGQLTLCEKAKMITLTAEKHHYKPVKMDDQFSISIFEGFIQNVDPNKLYFSTEDYEVLKSYKSQLDNEIIDQNCAFFLQVVEVYTQRIEKLNLFLQNQLATDFDFKQKDTLAFGKENRRLNNNEITRRWTSLLKYEALAMLPDSINPQTDLLFVENELKANQKQVVTDQIESFKYRFETDEDIADYLSSSFLNAIAETYDPHTNYFTNDEEQGFEYQLSKNIFSFGIELFKNEFGELIVSGIMPGTAAWKSGQINEGDILVAIKSGNKRQDLKNLSYRRVQNILEDETLTEAIFYFKKKTSEIAEVWLEKVTIQNDNNTIESFVLDGESRIGYVYLPAFYSNSFGSNFFGNGCANDIAKEIIKLKRQNIEGLVIDLRGNGGGAMLEAIRLSGSFINYGALGILHSRNEEPQVFKDLDRGVLFREPLAILVDQTSASASEFFASVMQRYNRAVIVGSQTYGKSTAQVIMPIDAYLYEKADSAVNQPSNEGYLKMTSSVFYNFDGTSYQNNGVVPDFLIPTIYDDLEIGERFEKNPIQVGKIQKKVYAFPLDSMDLMKFKTLSKDRIENSEAFSEIKNKIKSTSDLYHQIKIPLALNDYLIYIEKSNSEDSLQANKENLIFEVLPTNKLYNPDYILDMDRYYNEIKSDIYIRETYYILNDLITFE